MKHIAAAILFIGTLFASTTALPAAKNSPVGAAPDKLVFGLIAPRGVEATARNWRPFADAMSAKLKIPVELFVRSDFKEIVAAFKEGRLDLVWLGGVGALELAEPGHGVVFAQMVGKTGRAGYNSVLVVHKDSDIHELKDVLRSNKRLVYGDGDLKSTSGHMVPLYYAFVKNKINEPAKFFKEIKRGDFSVNAMRAARKEVDVATNNNEQLELFGKEHPELHANLRVIWTSPEIPQSPLVWRRDMSLLLKRQISHFVTGYGKTDAERAVLLEMNELSGFRKSTNRQLVTVADLELFSASRKLWNQWNNRELSFADTQAQQLVLNERTDRLRAVLRTAEAY